MKTFNLVAFFVSRCPFIVNFLLTKSTWLPSNVVSILDFANNAPIHPILTKKSNLRPVSNQHLWLQSVKMPIAATLSTDSDGCDHESSDTSSQTHDRRRRLSGSKILVSRALEKSLSTSGELAQFGDIDNEGTCAWFKDGARERGSSK